MAERKAADQKGFLSTTTKKLNLGSSGHTVDGTYMPSIGEKYKRPKTGIEKGFEQLGNFIGRITRPPGAEGATLDGKPGFENVGVVTPNSYKVGDTKDTRDTKDTEVAAYYGGPAAENRRRLDSFLKEFERRSPLGGGEGGTIKIPDMVPVPRASLGAKDGSLIAMADTKVDKTKREGTKFFTSASNNESNSQTATDRTKMAGEGIFRSGISSEAFSPKVKPQYQINRERNRPNRNENVAEAGARTPFGSVNLNIARGVDTSSTTKQAEDTSFSSYFRGSKPRQERGNTGLAQERKVANRDPDVSINKSTGRSGRFRAETTGSSADQSSSAASGDTSFSSYVRGGGEGQKRGQAVNKAKGFKSSVSTTTRQGKPRTKAQMAAAERKASGTTRSERNAARKKSMRDKARARNKSFKARRAAKAKARKAKNASNKAKRTRTRRTSNRKRSNRRSRGRKR